MVAFSPAWLAFRTVAEGLSARAGLRLAREAGLAVRDSTWFKLVGSVRNHYAQSLQEFNRPLNRRPTGTEVTPLPTKVAKGYVQYVDLFVRDKDTGGLKRRPQAIHTKRLLSREAVVEIAKDRYQRAIDKSKLTPGQWGTDPRETIEGGIYTHTHQFTPEP